MKSLLFIISCLIIPLISVGQVKKAAEILNEAIKYHDPNSKWQGLITELTFEETRPNGPSRNTTVWIDNSKGFFKVNRNNEEIHGMLMDSCFVEKGDVTCERANTLRNYYLYLWGLPMKLTDSGTPLSTEVGEETYENVPCNVLKVTYEKDTWYFYLSQSENKMLAYKFYKDEKAGKGELIKLEKEIEIQGIKIPKERSWYTLPEMKYLGTDILVSGK